MYTILATKKGTAEFITAQSPGDCERIADSKSYVRYEDALGGIFGKLRGEWIFLRQKKAKK